MELNGLPSRGQRYRDLHDGVSADDGTIISDLTKHEVLVRVRHLLVCSASMAAKTSSPSSTWPQRSDWLVFFFHVKPLMRKFEKFGSRERIY